MTYYPYEPTKWSEELASVYDRQSRQLQEHHDRLRARDAREVEVKQQESLVNTLAKVAEFSQAAGTLVKAHKASVKKKDDAFTNNIAKLFYNKPELLKQYTDIYNKNALDVTQMGIEMEQLTSKLRKDGKFDQLLEIERWNPRRNLLFKEGVAVALAPHVLSDSNFNNHLSGLGLTGAELEAKRNDLNYRTEFNGIELTNISGNENFAAKYLFEEFGRKESTIRNTRKAQQATRYNLKEDTLGKALLKSTANSVTPKIFAENIQAQISIETNSGKYTDIKDGPTAQQQATKAVIDKVVFLGLEGDIPQSALVGLEEKLRAAGSVTQAYFSKDGSDYNRIVKAVNMGQSKWLTKETVKDTQLATQLKIKKLDGEDVTRELQHLRSRGLVSDETITGIEKINTADNTQDAYKDESKYWNKSMQNGTLLTKENVDLAKEIKNEKLKAEVLGAQEKLQSSYNLNGFDSYEKRQRANGSLIMKQSQNRTLGENEVLEGFNERLQDEITNLESKLYAYYYNLNPEDSQIGIKVAIDKKKILDDNGFYAQPGDANEGIYTKDSDGNFTNYQNSLIGKVQVSKLPTERNRTIWSSNLYNVWERASNDFTLTGDTVKERVLNTLNSTLTPQDIIGIFESGEISDKLMYTAELFPDTNETEILIGATKALIASKDKEHQQIVKAFKLKEKLENIPTVQLKLKDKIKSLNDFDLNGIIDRGLQNASPNEKMRVFNALNINAISFGESEAGIAMNELSNK